MQNARVGYRLVISLPIPRRVHRLLKILSLILGELGKELATSVKEAAELFPLRRLRPRISSNLAPFSLLEGVASAVVAVVVELAVGDEAWAPVR